MASVVRALWQDNQLIHKEPVGIALEKQNLITFSPPVVNIPVDITSEKLDLIAPSPLVVNAIEQINRDGKRLNDYVQIIIAGMVDQLRADAEARYLNRNLINLRIKNILKFKGVNKEIVIEFQSAAWYFANITDDQQLAIFDTEFAEQLKEKNNDSAATWEWFGPHFEKTFLMLLDEYKQNLVRRDREERMTCNYRSLLRDRLPYSLKIEIDPLSLAELRKPLFD